MPTELGTFARTITDGNGNTLNGASVSFVVEETLYGNGAGQVASLWEDRLLATTQANPASTDSEGYLQTYLYPGYYKITATHASGTVTWRWFPVVGSAGVRNIGTDSKDVPDTDQLNTRLGTNGNLSNMSQQSSTNVSITGGTVQDCLVRVKYNELRIRDSDETHELIINLSSNLTASRTLNIAVVDGDRTLTLANSVALDQNLLTTSSPTFANFTLSDNFNRSVESGITASTTQTQGQVPLTKDINEISTCATTNDTVTLPAAAAGLTVTVINNGAQTLQIFPASGDNLGAGVDTATTLASGSVARYQAYNATNWVSI